MLGCLFLLRKRINLNCTELQVRLQHSISQSHDHDCWLRSHTILVPPDHFVTPGGRPGQNQMCCARHIRPEHLRKSYTTTSASEAQCNGAVPPCRSGLAGPLCGRLAQSPSSCFSGWCHWAWQGWQACRRCRRTVRRAVNCRRSLRRAACSFGAPRRGSPAAAAGCARPGVHIKPWCVTGLLHAADATATYVTAATAHTHEGSCGPHPASYRHNKTRHILHAMSGGCDCSGAAAMPKQARLVLWLLAALVVDVHEGALDLVEALHLVLQLQRDVVALPHAHARRQDHLHLRACRHFRCLFRLVG